ncbi:hypothetical protein LOK49_LG12G01154 [Camellia lanceoleosa]|uniref:Uncharacterized protein n=1 Tax=Camellia lanceoleosa TaxID=1840588 RepID=A0ACC0FPR4_9ERIC|nr:hypothetical protein LOK49_LG12G01154 [Camellia lanceoleosa]
MVSSDSTTSTITTFPPTAPPKPVTMMVDKSVITMEFQRKKAKELQEYFKQMKLDEADQGLFFGFIAKNEISNGRLQVGYMHANGASMSFIVVHLHIFHSLYHVRHSNRREFV